MATYNVRQSGNKGLTNGTNINHGPQYGYIETLNNYAPPSKSEAEKAREVMEWISPQDFSSKFGELRDDVVCGTGQWFLQSEEYKAWKRKDKKYLWVSGKPGAGKSFLSTIVIDDLKKSEKLPVAFLYLSYQHAPSVKDLLGNLASQLIAQRINSSEMPDLVRALWESEQNKSKAFQHAPEFSILEDLFSALVTDYTYLIVDALDEFDSSQRQNLLFRLKGIQNASLLVTSRNKKANGFEARDVIANENDIKNYIDRAINLSDLSNRVDEDGTLREEIKLIVTKKADGVFLLPRLHIAALATYHTPGEVRKALKNLPHDRNSTYESTLERISTQGEMGHWAMTAMSWIFHAQEPLQVDELQHALLIGGAIGEPLQAGDARFSHGDLLSKEAILACCCGLVEVKLNPHSRDTFRFIHYSVQEFFTARKERPFPNFHAHISLACAKYVSIPRLAHSNGEPENAYTETLQDGPNDYVEEHQIYGKLQEIQKHEQMCGKQSPHDHLDSISDKSRSIADYSDGRGVLKNLNFDLKLLLYPFIGYAGKYSGHHFSNIDEEVDRLIVEEQICRHLENSNFYIDLVDHVSSVRIPILRKVRFAAYIGSSNLVGKFTIRDPFPHGCGWSQWRDWLEWREFPISDALDVALDCNRPRVVKYILGAGDMTDLTDRYGHHELIRATKGTDERSYSKEVNQVLDEIRDYVAVLEKTANSKSWMTWASESVAEMFNPPQFDIHHFREVNPVQLRDHVCLLSASANGRSVEVSDILKTRRVFLTGLETDVSSRILRTKSWLVKSSFFLAIENLHLEVVKVFLDHGIDVDLEHFRKNETALHRAISKGSRSMAELLISYNARIDLEELWSLVRHSEVIQPLVRASNGQICSEALYSAVRVGDFDLVKTFLEQGVNPSVENKFGRPPIVEAIYNRDIETVKILLEYNADPNFRDEVGGTVLDAVLVAAEFDWKDNSEIMSQIEKGGFTKADVEEKVDEEMGKELSRWREISKLLKSHGAKTAKELQCQAADD